MTRRALTIVISMSLAAVLTEGGSACSSGSDATPPPPAPVVTPPTPPSEPEPPPGPPPPLPHRPFAAGDLLDAPEITVEGTEAGDAVFGYRARGAIDHVTVPLPRGCTMVKRSATVAVLTCPGAYGAVFAFYTRLTEPYVVTRHRFGGQFDEYGRVGIYRADKRQTLVVDVTQGPHAVVAIRTGGVALRLRGEPEGTPAVDPPIPESVDARGRLVRAYGAYRCGSQPVLVGVSGLVFDRDTDGESECRRLRLQTAGAAGALHVVCGELTGSTERLGARAQTYRSSGFTLRAIGADVEIDGQFCTADLGR